MSSISKVKSVYGAIFGGEPAAPYAVEDGHMTTAVVPERRFVRASRQHWMTPVSGRAIGPPLEESKTLPFGSLPVYLTRTESYWLGVLPTPLVTMFTPTPDVSMKELGTGAAIDSGDMAKAAKMAARRFLVILQVTVRL